MTAPTPKPAGKCSAQCLAHSKCHTNVAFPILLLITIAVIPTSLPRCPWLSGCGAPESCTTSHAAPGCGSCPNRWSGESQHRTTRRGGRCLSQWLPFAGELTSLTQTQHLPDASLHGYWGHQQGPCPRGCHGPPHCLLSLDNSESRTPGPASHGQPPSRLPVCGVSIAIYSAQKGLEVTHAPSTSGLCLHAPPSPHFP